MADPFVPVIVNSLQNYSDTNSLSWTCVGQDSPNRKEWNSTPLVIVAPSQKTDVGYIAYGVVRTVNNYDCYLVSTGDLSSDYNSVCQVFYSACRSSFMPANSAMLAAGAYMSRVFPKFDYDRSAFPKGWSSTCVEINVFYVT